VLDCSKLLLKERKKSEAFRKGVPSMRAGGEKFKHARSPDVDLTSPFLITFYGFSASDKSQTLSKLPSLDEKLVRQSQIF
jgi:hypothetical protein